MNTTIKQVVRDYPITLSVSVNGVLLNFAAAFREPRYLVFCAVFAGAVLVRGRHTVSRMILAAGIRVTHHAKFYRFFANARWSMADLWKQLDQLVIERFFPGHARIDLAVDDTAEKKTGGKIYGVGVVHDNRPALRKDWSFSWGHTWVVASLIVTDKRWPKHSFAVPADMQLYRKKPLCKREGRPFQTKPELANKMLLNLIEAHPTRRFLVHHDGGYSSEKFVKDVSADRVDFLGRIRDDAALYGLPPVHKPHRKGPRPKKGKRLGKPKALAARQGTRWEKVTSRNGTVYEVKSWTVLWWTVFKTRHICVVAVRRPGRKDTTQFLYTTDLSMSAQQVFAAYERRWPIEVLFHEAKERMGLEEPQCRTEQAVERTVPFLMLATGIVIYWYLTHESPASLPRPRWWGKRRGPDAPPAFSHMLTAMRTELLQARLMSRSSRHVDLDENVLSLIEHAAWAA